MLIPGKDDVRRGKIAHGAGRRPAPQTSWQDSPYVI
jgi:hypothetical protein